ncbi:pentatricopeptide repeat-containing protein At1g20300, mitochondrial-like [Phragmites australis]|uniref:pentatricopeptide repeat-containing protein At1g20300, mitochondrial-like n=1 Tax=Phragmites australis TaxID=29695 RepID=UPI002D76A61D|nr:pentatricopeptide repeat-containing protein At1g20300, mitochondrial-like [Phragmites australis]
MALLLKPKHHLSSTGLLLLLPRRLCDGVPNLPPPTDISPPPLTRAETKLLDAIHAALLDHHRANPAAQIPDSPPFDPLPSLSSTISGLLPSPPSPHFPLHLLRRLLALRRGVPFPEAVAFFHQLVPSLPADSLPDLYAAMIDLLAKHQHFPLARHLLDEMRAGAVPISSQLILALIRRYVRAGMSSEAAELFRRMEEYGAGAPEPAKLALLLGALSKKRLASEAQALFDSYKSVFTPDVVLYTAVVHAWCRAGQLDEAERVFAEMQQSGIMPNVYTYTAVIDAMYRAGQVPRAQELLCQMIDSGCPPNTATFNAIMRAHVKAGRSEQVLQVHNQMRQLGCEPDIITYNFLIETHCGKGQGNFDAALKVLAKMTAKGCVPDCHTFNPMFKLVLVLGNVDAARKLYDKMRELQCKPNVVTYNALLRLFNKEKSMDMVLRMKKDMDAEGVEPNLHTYAALIEAFCGRGNWRRAHTTLKEMVEEKSFKPSKQVYDMVLTLLRKAGQLMKHEELVELMADRGFISRPANDALWSQLSAR